MDFLYETAANVWNNLTCFIIHDISGECGKPQQQWAPQQKLDSSEVFGSIQVSSAEKRGGKTSLG